MRKSLAAIFTVLASAGCPSAGATAPPAAPVPAWLGIATHPLLEAMYLVAEHQPTDTLPYFERSFRMGNAVAPCWMARLLASGAQGKSGKILAAPWAAMAVVMGNPRGLLELGRLYENGIGVTKSADLAGYFFARAALKNVRGALRQLCSLAAKGAITNAGRRRILRTFQADAGTPVGEYCLAYLYNAGALVPKNPQKFKTLLAAAAAGGDGHAIFIEDFLQNCSPMGVWSHPKRAFRLARRAAHAGSTSGMTSLENFYSSGFGVAKNPGKARYWLLQGAKHDDPEAMYRVAIGHLTLPPMTKSGIEPGVSHRFSLAAAARWALRAMSAQTRSDGEKIWGHGILKLVLKMHQAVVAARQKGRGGN